MDKEDERTPGLDDLPDALDFLSEIKAHSGAWCFMYEGEDGNSWTQGSTAPDQAAASVCSLREALAKLLTTSQLLLQNAEGCAVNHYGEDFQKCGRPGWLADCENDIASGRAALSTLPVNDRHHSGGDSYQADADAPALSEKVNVRSEWLPIESAPHGPNLILAFRNDAGKWRRVIGWHAKQFEIEVDADELHSGLEEGPAGEAIYAKSGWYEYLDADEAPCNRIWPSHWMPLPSPPGAELNISNEAERDGASLKPDTSSQPASEAGKLSSEAES